MLPPSVVNEIRRLLVGQEMSYRKISRLTGVSRGTIGMIAADAARLRGDASAAERRSPRTGLVGRSVVRDAGGLGLSSLPPLRC